MKNARRPKTATAHSKNALKNPEWIFERARSLGLSQRELAEKVRLPENVVAKIKAKVRGLRAGEDELFAHALNAPIEELRRGVGVPYAVPTPNAPQRPRLIGYFDAKLALHEVKDRSLGLAPASVPIESRAARFQTLGSEHGGLDGAVAYWEAGIRKEGVSEGVGRPAIVWIEGTEGALFRVIQRGYARTAYNLTTLSGKVLEENVTVRQWSPVILLAWG